MGSERDSIFAPRYPIITGEERGATVLSVLQTSVPKSIPLSHVAQIALELLRTRSEANVDRRYLESRENNMDSSDLRGYLKSSEAKTLHEHLF